MPEQTNPATGVEQAAPSVEERMASFLEQREQDEARAPEQAEQQEQPQGQAESEELTPDDLPDEPKEAQPTVDAFEIVHNGQQHKLTREETIRYAQQGFDYTQKTQQLAEQFKAAQVVVQRAQELEMMAPALMHDMAQVQALGAQLKSWQNVDWVQLASQDPLEYPKHRAQFDTIKGAYDQAMASLEAKGRAYNQQKQQLTAYQLQQELPKLRDAIPGWKDPDKMQAGQAELKNWLLHQGADPGRLDAVNSALEVSIAWKAMQYDKLAKSKAEKVKQLRTAPPVTKPNAAQGPNATQVARDRDLEGRFKKSGDLKDAAAVLLNRWK